MALDASRCAWVILSRTEMRWLLTWSWATRPRARCPALRRSLVAAAKGVAGVENVSVNITTKVIAHAVQRGVQLLPRSRTSLPWPRARAAWARAPPPSTWRWRWRPKGASVGLLDADIYGPSQPMMMGINRRPESDDGKTMEPLENYGVQVMSIGFLVDQDEAMIWRGPMATQALEQLLRQTNWKDLDYLIVDMPPGTGDIQLTLSQRVPMTGAVIVTTPQDIALLDAKQGHQDVREGGRAHPGHRREHGRARVQQLRPRGAHLWRRRRQEDGGRIRHGLPGRAAAGHEIRLQADSGKPTVVADPDGEVAQHLQEGGARGGGAGWMRRRRWSSCLHQLMWSNGLGPLLPSFTNLKSNAPSGPRASSR
jgi:ATP-binding protein involved in chromosome partitioning